MAIVMVVVNFVSIGLCVVVVVVVVVVRGGDLTL